MLLRDAEHLSRTLPPLMIAALQTAASITHGAHGRRRPGVGDTFFQYRPYEPGESVTRIDWRASARGERLFVREQEWEAAQKVYFWFDTSASMHFHSHKTLPTKSDSAGLMGLALASLLTRGGELVGSLDGQVALAHDGGVMLRLHEHLTHADTNSLPPLARLSSRAHVVLLGDFLPQAKEMTDWLMQMSAQGVRLTLIEVADPAEETFPYKGPTRFEGLENEGSEELADPRHLRKAYLQRRGHLRSLLKDACVRAGGQYMVHVTDKPAEPLLQKIFTRLSQGEGR